MNHFFAWISVAAIALSLAGCPSSTTRDDDGGGTGNDAASGHDSGTPIDAFSATDMGPAPTWNSCSVTSDCSLAANGCCAPCGSPTLDELDAINTMHSDEHFNAVCPVPTPCPACATGNNPNLVATCTLAHCMAVDVSRTALSSCTTDSDCVIRYANCCSCSGDASQVISVRADAELAVEGLFCDGGSCNLDCVPQMEPGFRASCDPTTSRCAAVRLTH